MEFTIDAKLFTASLADAKRYIKGNRIPVLACCKLAAANETLTITATDLESALVLHLPISAVTGGVAVVPVIGLANALKGIKGNVTLQTSDGAVSIAGVTVPCECSADSFPEIPVSPICATWYELPTAPLRDLIGRTSFAISKEASRFTLNGARMELKGII